MWPESLLLLMLRTGFRPVSGVQSCAQGVAEWTLWAGWVSQCVCCRCSTEKCGLPTATRTNTTTWGKLRDLWQWDSSSSHLIRLLSGIKMEPQKHWSFFSLVGFSSPRISHSPSLHPCPLSEKASRASQTEPPGHSSALPLLCALAHSPCFSHVCVSARVLNCSLSYLLLYSQDQAHYLVHVGRFINICSKYEWFYEIESIFWDSFPRNNEYQESDYIELMTYSPGRLSFANSCINLRAEKKKDVSVDRMLSIKFFLLKKEPGLDVFYIVFISYYMNNRELNWWSKNGFYRKWLMIIFWPR